MNFLTISAAVSLTETNHTFEALLEQLRRSHGFDFTGYKRPSLTRRVQKRMEMVQIESYSDYSDYLKVHPEEFTPLFNTIEINYTGFFRDAEAWDYVAKSLIPQIITSKPSDTPIKVWSAGCASGEETYTLAIVLALALGVEQYKARVQIYATDIDEEALNQARLGSYLSSEVVSIPPALLNQYFEQADNSYVFRKDLRRSIIFCRHDLIQDAPMSKIDLLVCRNALIYFNIESQIRTLVRFHFALRDSGFLFLGKSEMLPTQLTNIFTAANLRHHIFTKLPRSNMSPHLLVLGLGRQHRRGT